MSAGAVGRTPRHLPPPDFLASPICGLAAEAAMKNRTAAVLVAAVYALGVLAAFGPPAARVYATATIFGV